MESNKKNNKTNKNTFSILRSIGNNVLNGTINSEENLHNNEYYANKFIRENGNLIKINNLDIESADKNVEKIIERNDFGNVFFISPLTCHSLVDNNDNDGNEYWKEEKPKLIERFNNIFGLRYGIDFAILRRGLFSIIALLTKKDDNWYINKNILDFIVPDRMDIFFKTLDFYYKNTDSMFFPINAIVASDENSDGTDVDVSLYKNTEIKTIQVDISFLRSDSFKEYDSSDGREHSTLHIFRDGIIHSLSMKYRILSFDDEIIDEMISGNIEIDNKDEEDENCL